MAPATEPLDPNPECAMRRIASLLPLAALLGCASAATNGGEPQPTVRWSASLQPAPAFEQIAASATAVRTVGTTTVQIEVTGAQQGGAHPWQVRRGTCGTGGETVGDAGRYPVIRPSAAGRALETAVVDAELQPGQPFHVVVFRAAADPSTVIACGDLREVGV